MTDASALDALVRQGLDRLREPLGEGLDPAEAAWAAEAWRAVVLPRRLGFALYAGDEETRARWVAEEIERLHQTLARGDRDARWRTIVTEYYRGVLAPLSDRAERLARQAASAQPDRDAGAAAEAELHALRDELRDHAPGALQVLESELSEALVDCVFVRAPDGPMSLRMHHWLEQSRKDLSLPGETEGRTSS